MNNDDGYKSWTDFEVSERRRVGTFQLSVDDLARDMYVETSTFAEEDELAELDFDF